MADTQLIPPVASSRLSSSRVQEPRMGNGHRSNLWPQRQALLRTCTCAAHLGHFFSHDRCPVLLDLAAWVFFCRIRRLRGASACWTAHCGWMWSREYDASPQIGQRFLAGTGNSGVGFSVCIFITSVEPAANKRTGTLHPSEDKEKCTASGRPRPS